MVMLLSTLGSTHIIWQAVAKGGKGKKRKKEEEEEDPSQAAPKIKCN